MKLKTLYERIISEILDFNNIEEYEFRRLDTNHYRVDIDDNIIDVTFGEFKFETKYFKVPELLQKFNGEMAINIGYSFNLTDTQFKKTNLKEFLPILKAIVLIINDYIKKNNPKLLLILSIDRYGGLGSDKSKDKIYQLLMKKYQPSNYGSSEVIVGSDTGSILYNIKLVKNNA